mgnify:CR=1 FL=1
MFDSRPDGSPPQYCSLKQIKLNFTRDVTFQIESNMIIWAKYFSFSCFNRNKKHRIMHLQKNSCTQRSTYKFEPKT